MKRYWIASLAVLAASVLVACGGKDSVASKSAAAYREAQAKGVKVGGDGGHSHGSTTTATTDTPASVDHAAMGHATTGSQTTATGAMDHAAMGHGGGKADAHAGMTHGAAHTSRAPRGATVDHAAMGHGTAATSGHAGHGGSTSTTADPHAGMQHGSVKTTDRAPAQTSHSQHAAPLPIPTTSPNAHAQHTETAAASVTSPPAAAPPNSRIGGIGASATLQPDSFDSASPISVAEAARATQGGGHEGHEMRGITPGEDRENPPTPMPATRDGSAPVAAPAVDHSQHGSQSVTAPASPSPSTPRATSPARATAPKPKAPAAAIYTCPMHPEVTSNKPGTCPKCGMALVRKK